MKNKEYASILAMNSKPPILGIVVPCYNEEAALSDSSTRLSDYLSQLIKAGEVTNASFIAFIDDGSRDDTWRIISDLAKGNMLFRGLKLSANVGHQNALLAGLTTFKENADCLISIDADLQDDIEAIGDMIKKFKEGNEIVYGVRAVRKTDSFAKRFTAETYYKLLKIFGVKIVYNHADFRLMSKKALDALVGFHEVNLFLRGLVPLLGFKTASVFYERKERRFGVTKYPLKKMLKLAFDGITSFSAVPLRMITVAGFLIFILSLFMSAYVVFGYLFLKVVSGWASIVLPMYLLGGIQLLAIGIIGEYLAKIYIEVKDRPRFIIEERI